MMLNIDFVIRLLVAGILGAIIGLDREYRAKEAGYRTHFLVSLGSALIMIVSQYGFQEIIKESSVTLDPSRVAAQVVSGIGFIGAGTIIFQKQIVRGLTTAAGIWATVGIGMAFGAGMYFLGTSATLVILFSQFLLHQRFITSNEYFGERVTVTLLPSDDALERFQQSLSQNKFEVSDIKVKSSGAEAIEVRFVVRIKGLHQIGPLSDLLKQDSQVQSFSISKLV